MPDIAELMLDDQRIILSLQQVLTDAGRSAGPAGSAGWLARVWDQLADVVETHLDAEEEICHLAIFGPSAAGVARMEEDVAAHGDIREAIAEARLHPVGSPVWWRAVKDATSACADQLERERAGLAEFRRRAGPSERARLGSQWSAFVAARKPPAATGQAG